MADEEKVEEEGKEFGSDENRKGMPIPPFLALHRFVFKNEKGLDKPEHRSLRERFEKEPEMFMRRLERLEKDYRERADRWLDGRNAKRSEAAGAGVEEGAGTTRSKGRIRACLLAMGVGEAEVDEIVG